MPDKLSKTMVALGVLLAVNANAQPKAASQQKTKDAPAEAKAEPVLDPKAVEVLKAMSAKLASARTMSFTAIAAYESPSRLGPPLVYSTISEVTLQRPDKLRVVTPADGSPSEFYYDGKTMMAFAPTENLVAVAEAPPTIDAALKAAYEKAAIYFPFTDAIVADPYADIAGRVQRAFYIGQSHVIGGTTTDMVGIADDLVFAQVWIGAEDKLPRLIRAIYVNDPSKLRHAVDFSNWKLDVDVPADAFTSARAAGASKIQFANPGPKPPPDLLEQEKASKTGGKAPKKK